MTEKFNILLVIILLAGCVPIPTKVMVSPAIEGHLYGNGKALSDYRVYFSYSDYSACSPDPERDIQVSVTDKNGYFFIPEKMRWSAFRFMVPVDSVANYNLCFIGPDGDRRWFYGTEITAPASQYTLKLNCYYQDLRDSPVETRTVFYYKDYGCGVRSER